MTLSRIGRAALDLLYPPSCALCGRGGSFLCDGCRASLPPAAGSRCGICWLPLSTGVCWNCSRRALSFSALRSAFVYEGPTRELVQRFKFGNLSSLAEAMALPMAAPVEWPVDAVQPVPLWSRHERERGYNQSALLAARIAAALGVPELRALRRTRGGPEQARSTREERLRNVDGAFAVSDASAIVGRRVLLVDDVATTGATLDACARALLAAGAASVTAVTFARED